MSNNYYMTLKISEEISWKIHIGNTNMTEYGYGLTTISGKYFSSVNQWIEFIRHNSSNITITDENEVITDNEEFIQEFLETETNHSVSQISVVIEHGETVHDFIPYDSNDCEYWVDKETGKLFFNKDFF